MFVLYFFIFKLHIEVCGNIFKASTNVIKSRTKFGPLLSNYRSCSWCFHFLTTFSLFLNLAWWVFWGSISVTIADINHVIIFLSLHWISLLMLSQLIAYYKYPLIYLNSFSSSFASIRQACITLPCFNRCHCLTSVRIQSYSGPDFPAFGCIRIETEYLSVFSPNTENTDQNNSKYGLFSGRGVW